MRCFTKDAFVKTASKETTKEFVCQKRNVVIMKMDSFINRQNIQIPKGFIFKVIYIKIIRNTFLANYDYHSCFIFESNPTLELFPQKQPMSPELPPSLQQSARLVTKILHFLCHGIHM